MPRITHRTSGHQIDPQTETLLIGTFNPETDKNDADFFYGRIRNHMWRLLPTAYGLHSLKGKSKEAKQRFITTHKIDFTDLIAEVDTDPGQEANYEDIYLDSRVALWNDVIGEMEKLPRLKRVGFTRKTFAGIPNMKARTSVIGTYCEKRDIFFKTIITPARVYTIPKQMEWTSFLREA